MSKIVAVFELTTMTSSQYDAIINELNLNGGMPEKNRVSHVAFPKGGGWCVIDVWNSPEALMEFGKNRLFPIFGKLGLSVPEPQIYPVHNFVGAGI
jgi:hypothetical protein